MKYPRAPLSSREKCNIVRRGCATVCRYVRAPVRAFKSQKYTKFRATLIDVTITAIYPDARLFLCDMRTRTTTTTTTWDLRKRVAGERDDGDCWMWPSKRMPPLAVAVQQWQNINLNLNLHPSCPPFAPAAPLSSSFVYSANLLATVLRGPGSRRAAFYLRISLTAFSSWPPSRFLPSLYNILVSRASVFRFNSLYVELYSPATLDSIRVRVVPTR